MISNIRFVSTADVFNINLSDHFPTLLIYEKERGKTVSRTFTCRDYSEENLKNYGEAISCYNWSFVYETVDVDIIWEQMYEVFTNLLDTFCPFKRVTIKKDWSVYITNNIIKLGHERDKLFRIAHRTKLDLD